MLDDVKVRLCRLNALMFLMLGVQDTEPVTSLAWGPNDESMIIASRSLQLRVFSVETGRPIRSFKVGCIGIQTILTRFAN